MNYGLYTDFNLDIDNTEFVGFLGPKLITSVRGEIKLNGEERTLSKRISLLNKILEKNHKLILEIPRKNVSTYYNFSSYSFNTTGLSQRYPQHNFMISELEIRIYSPKTKQIKNCDYNFYLELKRYFKYVGIVHRFKQSNSTASHYGITSLSDVVTIPISLFVHVPKTYEQLRAEELYAKRIHETLELPSFNVDELMEPKKKKKFWLF